MVQAIIFDFDGTLINIDMLTFLGGLVNKEKENEQLHQDFLSGRKKGIVPLMERINFLKGLTIAQIESKIRQAPPLIAGAKQLIDYAKAHGIKTVICSGNILPVLSYFQKQLGVDFIVGSPVRVKDNVIMGIDESDYEDGPNLKMTGIKKILKEANIAPEHVVAIGDSVADLPVFNFVKYKLAINPVNGFEKYAQFVIKDFFEVVAIIEKLNREP